MSLNFNVTDSIALTFDGINLTDEELFYYYDNNTARPARYYDNSRAYLRRGEGQFRSLSGRAPATRSRGWIPSCPAPPLARSWPLREGTVSR